MDRTDREFGKRLARNLDLPEGLVMDLLGRDFERRRGFGDDPAEDKGGLRDLVKLLALGVGGSLKKALAGDALHIEVSENKVNGRITAKVSGRVPERISLDALGNKTVAGAITAYASTVKSLEEKAREAAVLSWEIENLKKFRLFEPDAIKDEIWNAFPVFLRQEVAIVKENRKDKVCYILVGDNDKLRDSVSEELGAAIVARQEALSKASVDLMQKRERVFELEKWIIAKKSVVDSLRLRAEYLLKKECPELGEDFLGFEEENGQPVVTVAREVKSDSAGMLPPRIKRVLIGRHFSGEAFEPNVQEALGIKGMIAAVEQAIA